MDSSISLKTKLKELADPERAANLAWFFKTAPGEYGAGDIFHGLRVPELRKFAKENPVTIFKEITKFLHSKYHEERFLALLWLIRLFEEGTTSQKKKVYDFYMNNLKYVNNWDLVDLSAYKIPGPYLFDKDKAPLYKLASSERLWDRRVAVLATFHYLARGDFTDSLRLAESLINDPEDLIHKATGWMLREIGKRDIKEEEKFLKKYYKQMPRTMLRYSIEKFPEKLRKSYLCGEI